MIYFVDEPLHTEEKLPDIDAFPKVRSPWRRFFARSFDLYLYGVLLSILQSLVFNINILNRTSGGKILDSLIALLFMIIFEPILLMIFATTLGKWLLGIRVTDSFGDKLSYKVGLERVLTVFWRGYGLSIPIYNLVRLFKSYKECDAGETLDWELDSVIHLKDQKKWRIATYLIAHIVLFGVLFLTFSLAALPKNRGEISVAEFSENYNEFAAYYDLVGSKVLDDKGQWIGREMDSSTIYIGLYSEPPVFEFTETGGIMTGFAFDVELEDSEGWQSSYRNEIILSILSYVRAQPGNSLITNDLEDIIDQIIKKPFEDFQYTSHGVIITCEYTYSGYIGQTGYGTLFPDEDKEKYFKVEFRMYKE